MCAADKFVGQFLIDYFFIFITIVFEVSISMAKDNRVWLITGASKGLGLAFTKIALENGDSVIALARSNEQLVNLHNKYNELLYLQTDITDKNSVFTNIKKAYEHFGKLDIVINNAGIMILGMLEEFKEIDVRKVFETNYFGSLWVLQAVMPFLRKQKNGHIIQISSIGGIISGPMASIYSSTKFALEGLCESLSQEINCFNIRLTIVEPGGYWTNLYLDMKTCEPLDDYSVVREELAKQYSDESVDSDPKLAAEAILKIVNLEKPPLRVILGSKIFDLAVESYNQKIKTWKEFEHISRAAEKGIPAPEGYGTK